MYQLNRRTWYGQLLPQYRVPTHRLYTWAFSPSSVRYGANTGQTGSHGATSQCRQNIGMKELVASAGAPSSSQRSTRSQCTCRPYAASALPTTGTLFSAMQATTQAAQPTQASTSTAMPQR